MLLRSVYHCRFSNICKRWISTAGWGSTDARAGAGAGAWAIRTRGGPDPTLAAYEAAARAKQAEAAGCNSQPTVKSCSDDGSPRFTSVNSSTLHSTEQSAAGRQPVAPASADVLASPPALMEVAQSDPSSVLTALLPSFRRRIHDMSGRALANAIGTCVLSLASSHTISSGASPERSSHTLDAYTAADAEDFLAAAFSEPLLRKLIFDATDQALLLHAHVALQEYLRDKPGNAAISRRMRLPLDISNACLLAHNRQVLSLQGLYDVVTLQLRRLGLQYSYRKQLPHSGYMTWILLPCDPEAAIFLSGGWTPRRWGAGRLRGPSSVALWIEGEWNMLTGSAIRENGDGVNPSAGAVMPWEEQQQRQSLAHRLMLHNIAVCDAIGHVHITDAERCAWLGPGSGITDVGAKQGDGRPRLTGSRADCESLADLLRFLVSNLKQR